ncbi:MAG TPA: ATPase domain-containing protein [Kofleriaceae bacterium]|jgi:circadian clock protein KaiC|nr:ATPase domain-containing protein [Polyangiales bacterium]
MTDEEQSTVKRHSSGISGLDQILGGGLFVGGVYLLAGRPGAGKTLLSNQIAFDHTARGGRVLYITLLAESHARMLALMEPMSFFRGEHVGTSLQYISGYQALEKGKLAGLVQVIRAAVRSHRATLLVVDGLLTAHDLADTDIELKKFVHELQTLAELAGCTTLLLRGAHDVEASYPERTMADGLVLLSTRHIGMRSVREIDVQKHRGSAHVMGSNFFEISNKGLTIYPRTETRFGVAMANERDDDGRVATGVASLEAVFRGGLPERSSTMLLGSPGSGKTLLGLQFLEAGARAGDPALYFGFNEAPARIARKAKAIGLELKSYMSSGLLDIQWHAPQEPLADKLADALFDNIKQRQVRRVFIDGVEGFEAGLVYPERRLPFSISIDNELRLQGVTALMSGQVPAVLGGDFTMPLGASEIVDNIVLLRHIENGTHLQRLASVMKMRDQPYETSVREFEITAGGIRLRAQRRSKSPRRRKARG